MSINVRVHDWVALERSTAGCADAWRVAPTEGCKFRRRESRGGTRLERANENGRSRERAREGRAHETERA
jgi:hypothetical protein